nr:zinc finger, CCHC-type, retrotransposon Gag domain protein [Tanacetum cinerariifolium]
MVTTRNKPNDNITNDIRNGAGPSGGDAIPYGIHVWIERILHDLERLDVELCVRDSGGYWESMRIESNLMLQIKEAQKDDDELWAI